jgi:hypothetical protein
LGAITLGTACIGRPFLVARGVLPDGPNRRESRRHQTETFGRTGNENARHGNPALLTSLHFGFRHRDVEAVQRDGDEAVQSHQVDQFGCAVLSELLDGLPIGQFG